MTDGPSTFPIRHREGAQRPRRTSPEVRARDHASDWIAELPSAPRNDGFPVVTVGAVMARGGAVDAYRARAIAHRIGQAIGSHRWCGSGKIKELRVKLSADALAENPYAIDRAVDRALGEADG